MAKNTMDLRESYTQTLDIDIYPKGADGTDGASITDVKVDSENHLICTLSNGTTVDAGKIKMEAGNFDVEVVTALPTENISLSTIYCVPADEPKTNNQYDEYVYVNSAWEQIGSTAVDFTNYYNKTEIDNKVTEINSTITTIKTDLEAEIEAHSANTVVTENAEKEGTYYLLGSNSNSADANAKVINSCTNQENSGIKYIAGSEVENGKAYIDEERITTGLYFTIS
jgi:hypothetical protein